MDQVATATTATASATSFIGTMISQVETILNRAFDNIYISTAIKVFIGLYAALAAPKLPASLLGLFDNTLVRVAVAFVIVMIALREPSIALMVALAFMVTLQSANKLRLYNSDMSVALPGEVSWLPSSKNGSPLKNDKVPFLPHHANVDAKDVEVAKASRPSDVIADAPSEPFGMENGLFASFSMEPFEDSVVQKQAVAEHFQNLEEETQEEAEKADAEHFRFVRPKITYKKK